MQIIDNINKTVKDDLQAGICKGSRMSVAAACFSIYAYQELKKQLEGIDELRFIFTSPTFVTEKASKAQREFYIPRISRESSLYGTEFEVKLRNELTQKAIAKECADWIRRKATFKSNTTGENMAGFMVTDSGTEKTAYMPLSGFTTVDIGCERGNNSYNMVNSLETPFAAQYLQVFDSLWNDKEKLQDVTDVVLENITTAYNENSPELIYFITLYNVFSEFLEDVSEDVLPNEATGFKNSKIWNMLYDFQKDAALAIINKLEKYNGCILADSVGLGKTFTALAVIKYYENRNKSVLVLCPKKLAENWNTYKDNYVNNPIASDRLNYTVLFHTDLSRTGGQSNGIQDYVFTDGSAEKSVKRKFAESLDGADEVFIYAKLPRGFFIPTPVGHYSPDWAIVFHEGAVKHIYFVAETKGTMESLNLRPIEKSKIDCAKKLFAKLSDGLVIYDHVSNYQELLNKVLK